MAGKQSTVHTSNGRRTANSRAGTNQGSKRHGDPQKLAQSKHDQKCAGDDEHCAREAPWPESCQLAERDLQTEQCRGTPQEPFARQLQTTFNFLWKRHQIAQDDTRRIPMIIGLIAPSTDTFRMP
ncbi:hypothetical protein SAMN03080618_03408 [Aquamicrobium aerolatum DSM 21857]|uniref:Uncharacterized protein n=1 Tax=Aquamicrobium aerolatum DSM 21857 TaxID=1121003 RepID=A0A1I3SPT5_9HYPH|nr:hypothetical protein SAMN03080618_03408 [Aquamicrobium aerolatum DSM 21857]